MRIKGACIIFAVCFMIMLVIPLIFTDLSSNVISKNENRMLSKRPPLSEILHPRSFVKNFEAWFNDHIGFREQLIILHKKLDNFDRRVRYTDGELVYLIGEEGHHFFAHTNSGMIPKFQGKSIFTDKQLQDIAKNLDKIKKYLDKKDIPFIVMLCTDKESVYPEYYPKTIKRGPEPNQLDIVTNYLQKNTQVDIFNIRQCLLNEKNNYLVYNKSKGDLTHYNEIGAFFSYRELMKHINKYFPNIIPYTLNDIGISYDGDEIPKISLKRKILYKPVDSVFFDSIGVQRPFTPEAFAAYENRDSSLPTILFMRDSYAGNGTFLTRYIPQHFGKTILIHYKNMERFEQYIDTYKPDIVIFEAVERELESFGFHINKLKLQ